MAFDAINNFGITTVTVAPSPALSGTTITLALANGPGFPCQAVVWPADAQPIASNAEIVTVTGTSGGTTFTIVREQEGTDARTIVVGDQFAANITAKTLTDIQGATQAYYAGGMNSSVLGSLEMRGPISSLPSVTQTFSSVVTFPIVNYAADAILGELGFGVHNLQTASDGYDILATVFVCNSDATETITVEGSANVGISATTVSINWSDATVIDQNGTDLSWDAGAGLISTATGGPYSAWMKMFGEPD